MLLIGKLLVAASLALPVSTDQHALLAPDDVRSRGRAPTSVTEWVAETWAGYATACVAKEVQKYRRTATAGADLNDLISKATPACRNPLLHMIGAYDAAYGSGSGEKYFMGPYMDELPQKVRRMLKAK